jgi:hypothetical protein
MLRGTSTTTIALCGTAKTPLGAPLHPPGAQVWLLQGRYCFGSTHCVISDSAGTLSLAAMIA